MGWFLKNDTSRALAISTLDDVWKLMTELNRDDTPSLCMDVRDEPISVYHHLDMAVYALLAQLGVKDMDTAKSALLDGMCAQEIVDQWGSVPE